jgi:hypothetical protein
MKRTIFFLFFIVASCFNNFVLAQLDTIHYMPPMHARQNAQVEQHYLYLSTPEATPFIVTLTDGMGNVVATPTISAGSPTSVYIGNGQVPGTELLVRVDSVGIVLSSSGIIATARYEFYCNFRVTDNNQAASATAKGRAAFGQLFYVGSMPQLAENSTRSFIASVMATEDSTSVTVSGYDPGVIFKNGAGPDHTDDVMNVYLNAGESYIFTGYTNVVANRQGFVGAKIEADRNIVVNTGNMCGSITAPTGTQDLGIDQIVPADRLGDKYVLLRGNGRNDMEQPLVVAIEPGTEIFVNGAATPLVTLASPGDFFLIPESNYTGTLHENMYVTGSKNFYMYQPLGGSGSTATGGLNFIPPVSCFLPNSVDLVPDIDKIGPDTYSGSLVVVTVAGSSVLVNGAPVDPAYGPELVGGSGGTWETYNIIGLTGDADIVSDNAMAVGFFGFSGNAGFAGYYSGFGRSPNIILSSSNLVGGVPCLPADSLYLADIFDSYQWFKDGVALVDDTTQTYTPIEEAEYFVVLTTAACIDTSQMLMVFDCETLLPIELLSFEAEEIDDDYVELSWVTASEINNDYFEVERSLDGVLWQPILTKDGAGNSSMVQNYLAYDRDPFVGYSYYRLKQVDFDGAFTRSAPVSVYFNNPEMVSIYPNPVRDEALLSLNGTQNGIGQLFIYAVDGRLIQSLDFEVIVGVNTINVDLSLLSAGTYQIKIITPDFKNFDKKIIKLK